MPQSQNRISIRFFEPKLKPKCFLLSRLPEDGGEVHLEVVRVHVQEQAAVVALVHPEMECEVEYIVPC